MMDKTLSAYTLIELSPTVSDLYNLIDRYYEELDKSQDYEIFKLVCSAYTGAIILHERNYQIILYDFSRIINDSVSAIMLRKLREEETKDALIHVIEELSHLVAYNKTPTMLEMFSAFERMKNNLTVQIFKRFKYIEKINEFHQNVQLLRPYEEVILLVSYRLDLIIVDLL
jgi:hypothetical protein